MQKLWFGPKNHRNRNSQRFGQFGALILKCLFVLRTLTASYCFGQDFWLQNHCSRTNSQKNMFFGAFWPVLGKLFENLFFWAVSTCFGQDFWNFCCFVYFDLFWAKCRKTTVLGQISENSVFFWWVLAAKPLFWAKFLQILFFCALWLQNLANVKMSGKQRELGPNSGKTAGKRAQTAGIWKILEKSVVGHKLPKNHQNSEFQRFFANFGCNSGCETWFVVLPCFATPSGHFWVCLKGFVDLLSNMQLKWENLRVTWAQNNPKYVF